MCMCGVAWVGGMGNHSPSGVRRTCKLDFESLDGEWVMAKMRYLLYTEKLIK